jgi:hypothetical protein
MDLYKEDLLLITNNEIAKEKFIEYILKEKAKDQTMEIVE